MFSKHRRRCFGALKSSSAFMQGLIRKTEKPTKKKQRKSNEEGMARDEPTSKKCRAMWQGASPPALRSLGPEATLTTSETVTSGRSVSDHTEVGPDQPPCSQKAFFPSGISPSVSQSWVPGPPASVALQMQVPRSRPRKSPGWAPWNLHFQQAPGRVSNTLGLKQQYTWVRAQVLDPRGFKSQLLRSLLTSPLGALLSSPKIPILPGSPT